LDIGDSITEFVSVHRYKIEEDESLS
jgi:hypothetical protein